MRTPAGSSSIDPAGSGKDKASESSVPTPAHLTEQEAQVAGWSETDLAELRLAWGMSRDRRVAAWLTMPAAALTIFCLTVVAKFLARGPAPTFLDFIGDQPFWWLGGLLAALYAAFGAYLMSRSNFRNKWAARKTLGQQAEELRQADLGVQNDASPEFAALWRATQARLDYYHQIATAQSKQSFRYGQLAAVAGFVVAIVAAFAAAFSRTVGAAIAAAVTGVAGGGLGGYIGATFMRAQENAIVQLQAYFEQPLQLSRILAAERLLDRLDDQHRQQSVQDIIRAVVITPTVSDAQIAPPAS